MTDKTRLNAAGICSLALALVLGLAGCEKGPAEKAGHKVDEAVDSLAHGGHESVGDKIEDKVDDAKDKVKDAADK